MDEYEFLLYQQFMNEMLPALASLVEVELDVRFSLGDEDKAWHVPIGDVCWLDKQIAERDIQYRSLRASEYW